jgi:hypothetical protein
VRWWQGSWHSGMVVSVRPAYMLESADTDLDANVVETCSSHGVSSSSRSHMRLVRKKGNDMRNTLMSLINWRPSESVFADQVSKRQITPHSINTFLVGLQALYRRRPLSVTSFCESHHPMAPPLLPASVGTYAQTSLGASCWDTSVACIGSPWYDAERSA